MGWKITYPQSDPDKATPRNFIQSAYDWMRPPAAQQGGDRMGDSIRRIIRGDYSTPEPSDDYFPLPSVDPYAPSQPAMPQNYSVTMGRDGLRDNEFRDPATGKAYKRPNPDAVWMTPKEAEAHAAWRRMTSPTLVSAGSTKARANPYYTAPTAGRAEPIYTQALGGKQ